MPPDQPGRRRATVGPAPQPRTCPANAVLALSTRDRFGRDGWFGGGAGRWARGLVASVLVTVLTTAAIPAMTHRAAAATGAPALAAVIGAAPADPGARLPTPQPSPEQARRDADNILSRPEYAEPPKSLTERVGEWLQERFQDLFEALGSGGGFGAGIYILIAVLVGVAVFLVSRVRAGAAGRRAHDPLFVTEFEAGRSPVQWDAEAERHERNGEWKQALRCRFRALIATLIDRGVVRDIPGRTSGEYRIEVARRAPHVGPAFAGASGLFDAAWYGDEPTGPAENEQFRAHARAVMDGINAPVAAVGSGNGSAGGPMAGPPGGSTGGPTWGGQP